MVHSINKEGGMNSSFFKLKFMNYNVRYTRLGFDCIVEMVVLQH